MKYLKSFRMITESTDVLSDTELISLVNKKLIDDLKDLSLYAIDEGFSLLVFFYSVSPDLVIGSVEIDHEIEEYAGYLLPIGTKIKAIEKYSFILRHNNMKANKDDMIEILDRVKYLNPGVNIKIENEYMFQ